MLRKLFFPVVIGLGGFAILLWLGTWQIQRLAWKEGLLAEIEARIVAPPVALPEVPTPAEHTRLPVITSGRLTGEELYVFTPEQGGGYRVIGVLETKARRVLLDLGFVPNEGITVTRSAEALDVVGNIHWPDDTNPSTPAPSGKTYFARDIAAMSAVLGTEPTLVIARDISPDQGTLLMPVGIEGIKNDHLGYAVTWYSLAVVWLIMNVFYAWRLTRRKEEF